MPIGRLKCVFSCSSEDKNYPAANLLKDANKKWKCAEIGLKSAYVILQLEKPVKIIGIDIGNENSGFIEVLVGKAGWSEDRYQNILLTSSFMLPLEGRNSENTNRVRCFSKDALLADVCDEKWDMVKIVCTQPYNKHVQYGLSFIKIHTNDEVASKNDQSSKQSQLKTEVSPKLNRSCDEVLDLPKQNVFSQFKFREESPDSDKETGSTSSSLFSKWKQTKHLSTDDKGDSHTKSPAAAIREATSSMAELEKCTVMNKMARKRISLDKTSTITSDDEDNKKPKAPALDRNRDSLLYDDDDNNTSIPKLEKFISRDKERIEKEKEDQLASKSKKGSKYDKQNQNKKKSEASADKFKVFLASDLDSNDNNDRESDEIEPKESTKGNKQKESPVKPDKDLTEVPSTSATSSHATPVRGKRRSSIDTTSVESPMKRTKPEGMDESSERKQRSDDKMETTTTPEDDEVPMHLILRGIVFVISGIQNPDRADIRDKGLKLGAKYRPDWDSSCTHLICAFPNTPKYKQVQQGHGKIVNRNWINDCFDQKKKLPWRRYEL